MTFPRMPVAPPRPRSCVAVLALAALLPAAAARAAGPIEHILDAVPISTTNRFTQQTPIAERNGALYVVNVEVGPDGDSTPNVSLRTVIRKGVQRSNGTWGWTKTLLEDRTVHDTWHTVPAVGIDEAGYVHVAYNMHNFPWQYAVSQTPGGIDGFDFRGQSITDAEIDRHAFQNQTSFPTLGSADIPGNQITYPAFDNDASGRLYVSYRFAAKPKRSFSDRTMSTGIARYDVGDGTWESLGGSLNLASGSDYAPGGNPAGELRAFSSATGWTTYMPQLAFGPDGRMTALGLWRSGTAGSRSTRPCAVTSADGFDFETLDGDSIDMPLRPQDCGNIGVPDATQHYTIIASAADAAGRMHLITSPVGQARRHHWWDGDEWRSETVPNHAQELLFDADDNLWLIGDETDLWVRRAGASGGWEQINEGGGNVRCMPRAVLDASRRVAYVHSISCSSASSNSATVTRVNLSELLGDDPDPVETPEFSGPADGATLTSRTVTFKWNTGGRPTADWWLYLGTAPGRADIADTGNLGGATQVRITSLPADGAPVHGRLYYHTAGADWASIDATWTASGTSSSPDFTAPAATLSGTTESFAWVPGSSAIAEWWLYAGRNVGARDLGDTGSLGQDLGATLSGLPTDGSTVHARLWYRTGTTWRSVDRAFTAAELELAPPRLASPASGRALDGGDASFEWDANDVAVADWWLWLGSRPGGNDVLGTGSLGAVTGHSASGLPTDGRPLHATLWYRPANGTWASTPGVVAAAAQTSDILSPTPGARLQGGNTRIRWTSGAAGTQHWLYVGSAQGGSDLFDSGALGAVDEAVVPGLSVDGAPVFVRLWRRAPGGQWTSVDTVYAGAD